MVGATSSAAGRQGFVPIPSAGDQTKCLSGAATWVACAGGGGSGLTSLNGLTADPQTFARTNDTNVLLTITSSSSTHTFAVSWSGTLGQSRGGFGASVAAESGYPKATAGTFSFSSSIPWADVSKSGATPGDVGAAAASHTHAESDVTGLVTDLAAKEATANKGAASGYASLDGSTKVPIGQLPTGSTSSTVTIGNDSRLSDARTPTAHASSHQNGGSDEIATATAAANAIPKAGAGGKLAVGWVPVATGDAGSGGTAGLVPAPATGDATKFLRGDMAYVTISGGGDALTANPLSQFASTTSAQLASVISDEIGSSGGFVRGTGSTMTNTTMAGTLNLPGGTLASIPSGCAIRDVYIATDQTGGRVWYICTATNTWSLVSPAGNPFTDNEDLGFNASDPTKLFRLDLSGFTTGTRRTQAPPNANGTWLLQDDVATVTNKRITPRVGSTTSTATPSISADSYDAYKITALATDITGVTITGTPTDFQYLQVKIVGTATRAITWGASFVSSTATLPTTTSGTTPLYTLLMWDADLSKWVCMAVD